jgi:hypothetical protein
MKKIKITIEREIKTNTWEEQCNIDEILNKDQAFFLRKEIENLAKKYLLNIKYNNLTIVEI